ncbi:G1/S-specific cyclin-E2-like [Sinocyclocheilus rhinocerous]|uniref:G1/S-specific cyclin-E2-like n=1 Tax=Sinocyclocheilus rhinocerous TaxID=307959 RepID=UPI0007B7D30A|nr:PREDICTED: G1/S-specific cyclin-E2-like [Sinocyclocheilus rhinocerous]
MPKVMARRSGCQQARSVNGNTRKIARVKKECNKRRKSIKKLNDSQNVWRQNGLNSVNEVVSDSSDQTPDAQPSPLPTLSWGSSEDVWMKMLSKEIKYEHSKSSLDRHPSLRPKMRAMLLDWLMEVCESYTLHRQTFYLAQDFFDRYMLSQSDVQKDQLQLIGITALFISSKIEEIYPPKITELAYVSDGACLEEEILQMELIMLKALNWDLCPETVLSWMKLYIQIASLYDLTNLLVPQFPQETYIQITQLLDLCILDINSLDFKYGVLAAAAFCRFMSADVVQKVSGLKWEAIETCVNWMAPFVETLMCYKSAQLKEFGQVPSEDRHNIQTHGDYLSMLKEAQEKQSESLEHFFPPTPPSSAEKPS